MENLAASVAPLIEWGVANHVLRGQETSGDIHIVKSFSHGVLLAAVDGIGHGQEAASAAAIAGSILEAHSDEPVIKIVQQAHEKLRGTRGVVMSIAGFNLLHGLMTWLGVGNVTGVLLRSGPGRILEEESLLLRSGVIGARLPPLQAAVLPLSPGDTLILATDGIETNFDRQVARSQAPQKAAQAILDRHGKSTDDALVLVARYFGNQT